jgi:cleavage and polyadenylation specificity factor subunit 1
VKNEFFSRPLSKGIVDGQLVATFETLPINKQDEMTTQIGTQRQTVLQDWSFLDGAW